MFSSTPCLRSLSPTNEGAGWGKSGSTHASVAVFFGSRGPSEDEGAVFRSFGVFTKGLDLREDIRERVARDAPDILSIAAGGQPPLAVAPRPSLDVSVQGTSCQSMRRTHRQVYQELAAFPRSCCRTVGGAGRGMRIESRTPGLRFRLR